MAIAHDATTNSHRTATTDPWTFTHTPSGTPRAVTLLIINESDDVPETVLTVTYGGVAMKFLAFAGDGSENLGVWGYFLGASIPTGAQTVEIDFDTATTDDFTFLCTTWTASDDCEVVDFVSVCGDNQDARATLATNGATCQGVAALGSGLAAVPSEATGCTNLASLDLGTKVWSACRQTTPSSSAFEIGYTSGADDVSFVAFNFKEGVSSAPSSGFYRKVGHASFDTAQTALTNGVFAHDVPVGARLLVVVCALGSVTFSNYSDSAGNSKSTPSESLAVSTNFTIAVFEVDVTNAITGGAAFGTRDTFTCTISASQLHGAVALDYRGFATAPSFDVSAEVANTTAGTAFDTPNTATTAQADELLLGMAGVNNRLDIGVTADSPFVYRSSAQAGLASNRAVWVFDRTVSATGQYTFGGDLSSSQINGAVIATFKLAAVGPPTSPGWGRRKVPYAQMPDARVAW